VDLAPELTARLSRRGWMAVSGFAPSQCSQVTDSLRPLKVLAHRTGGEWSALVMARRPEADDLPGGG
jgi:ribosomal protein L11 methylase PrmA